jgi:glutamate-1-semialdehyde 2,1-aminomutase
VSTIEEKYRRLTPKSGELTERAKRVIPGGETRSAVYFPPYSLVVDRSSGARVWDVDDNEYLDLNNNYTCLVHGHAYPPVVEAAQRATSRGTTWVAKTLSQIELAELIVDRVASVDEVRFANSGSEGVHSALEIARGYNGRSKILISTFSFHGHLLVPGHLASEQAPPDFVGTYIGTWGDAASFEKILAEHGDEIAIVLLEPWLGAGGMVGAPVEFFNRVQAAAQAAGVLFAFDEATVFRLSTGGAQALLGIAPDLTVLGKLIGGGFPCGGVGGRREIMELANPVTGTVHISGTFSGNPVAMAAGTVAVRELTADRIATTATHAERIEAALRKSAANLGVPFSCRRVGSMLNVWLSDALPAANHVREDVYLAGKFHLACLANGIFSAWRGLMNVSTVTTDNDVTEMINRLDAALTDVAAEM